MKLIKVKKKDSLAVPLKSLKKGEYFTLKPIEEPKENDVFVKGDYVKEDKKFSCTKFSDTNSEKFFPGTKQVYVDFTF